VPDVVPVTTPHQAIYRRFRAQTFGQIVGQPAVVETLRNAVRLGRLGHAFLFVGPRGTGKTSMARILAKAVNCANLLDGEPDDTCPSCVAIREGRALDVSELDAASNNRVDDMRELLPRVYTAPSDLRNKVFIIDEVQRIKEGWDVLLKTLEEPPEGVLFIFCTTDPSQIRPAVVSRLQRFTFRPLSSQEIGGKLERILAAEGRSAEPEAVALIARLAAGGMRDAESMLDQVLANADDPVTADSIRDLLGLAESAAVDGFIRALATGDALAGIAVLDRLEADGRDVVAFAEQVVMQLRATLMERLASPQPATGDATLGAAQLAAAARRLTGVDASRSGLGGYRWQLELALLGAAGQSGPPAPTGQAGLPDRLNGPAPQRAAVAAAEATPTPPKTPPAPLPPAERPGQPSPAGAAPAGAAAAGADPLTEVQRAWPEIVAAISRSPANKPLVTACRPVEFRDGVVVLGFPEHQAFLREKAEARKAAFEDGLQLVLGRPVGVRCVVANLEAMEPPATGSDDLVEQARQIFQGELADVGEVS
jgi:DNA polymerase III subunit gamma/tau